MYLWSNAALPSYSDEFKTNKWDAAIANMHTHVHTHRRARAYTHTHTRTNTRLVYWDDFHRNSWAAEDEAPWFISEFLRELPLMVYCCVLQWVAVCYSVLQYVAAWCSVCNSNLYESCLSWYTAVSCSVLQYLAVSCIMLQSVAACVIWISARAASIGILQCVAVCCSVLQCGAVWCSVLQCIAVYCSVLQRV